MYANCRNFRIFDEIGVEEHDGMTSYFRPKVEIWPIHTCVMKTCNIALSYGRIAEIFEYWRKTGLRNTMVTSDLRPQVEIRPFRACAMKNTQY